MVSMVMCSMGAFYVAERDDPMEQLKTAVPKMSLLSLILLLPLHILCSGCRRRTLFLSRYDLGFDRCFFGIFHAAWFCHGRNRTYSCQKCRQHRHEKFYGFCSGHYLFLDCRLWPDVRGRYTRHHRASRSVRPKFPGC